MSQNNLILAVPSKGRLEESTAALFIEAGMALTRTGQRGYTGTVAGIDDIEVQYLSASEIAARLTDGSLHFGITGEDLLREEIRDLESAVQLVLPLGFGRADVVVAVPDGWVDVRNMADLAEVTADFRANHAKPLRVATKYTHLTADFFARHEIADYIMVQSFGATEAAPQSGAAEVIVDITSTGATLAANQLRVPDDGIMLKSEANLAAALKADWHETARGAARRLLRRLDARRRAATQVQVTLSIEKGAALALNAQQDDIRDVAKTYGAVESNPSVKMFDDYYSFQLAQKHHGDFIESMMTFGFTHASVSKLDFVYANRNPLYEKLMGAVR